METIRKIRLAARDKKSIRQVARDLRLSRNTVRKVLRSGETRFEYHRETVIAHSWPPTLSAWKDY